jgi:hypothetical protein
MKLRFAFPSEVEISIALVGEGRALVACSPNGPLWQDGSLRWFLAGIRERKRENGVTVSVTDKRK